MLIKLYIIEKTPLVGLLSIQKFENSKCDFKNLKLLSYELYEDLSVTRPLPILVKDLNKSLTYMSEMFQYQGYLRVFHPGQVVKVNVKDTFWSDNVDFTLTIVDSDDEELIKTKTCTAIIIGKNYANDFIYVNKEGNLSLCKQVKTSRLIMIRANPFNNDSVEVTKDKVSHYILLFRFADCETTSIPIMLMSDPKSESTKVYGDERITIQDVVESGKKESFRQLIFNDNETEIQSEIKLILTSNSNVKNDKAYIPLPTINKYKNKNLRSCLDPNYICSFYIKSVLCSLFFLDTSNFPEKQFEVLILGAGIGTINHFFNKMLKNQVNITAVEIDKSIVKLGEEYFGMENSSKNYHWVYEDASKYLQKELQSKKNAGKYDLIVIDINNTNTGEGISPPPVFFNENNLKAIKVKNII
jgi:hypothetical protein